jgi:AcrR family transcriptional regulator
MPITRLARLAPKKRERLFAVAAQEFAAWGFEQASLNRILEAAQMGKSSAYYYFEDKADLFGAVIEHARECLHLDELTIDPATLTAETFWPTVAQLRREPFLRSFKQLWLFRVLRTPAHLSSPLLEREPLAHLALDEASDQWLMSHWEQMDRAEVSALSDATVDAMSKALAPGTIPAD